MAISEKSIPDKIEKSSLAEELREELEYNNLAFATKYSHKKDLENLLKLAEELKEKCDSAKTKINRIKYIQLAISIGTVYLLSYSTYSFLSNSFFTKSYESIFVTFFLIVAIMGLVGIFIASFNMKDMKKTYFFDKLALSEVLQLLRETSTVIAEQENWSVLSRAEFRIRLSRFNLDEKSKSAFNLFS